MSKFNTKSNLRGMRNSGLFLSKRNEINRIYLQRKRKVILKEGNDKLSKRYLASFCKNIEELGFILSKEIINILKMYSILEIDQLHQEIIPILHEMKGNRNYAPMYPNFPKQVMKMDDAELYMNAIMHYLGDAIGLRILPKSEIKKRRTCRLEKTNLETIALGSIQDFHLMFEKIMSSSTSISKSDQDYISQYISLFGDLITLPEAFSYREIGMFVIGNLVKHNVDMKKLHPYFNTATDVLRFATSLSDGDVSLANSSKFISFSRKMRKVLLNLLENSKGNIVEDMLKHRMKWIRLGERIHPQEYGKKFPKSNNAFHIIRNNVKISTFNGKIEELLEKRKILQASSLLKKRSGLFLRRLDHLLRLAENKERIIDDFSEIIHECNTTSLINLGNHFKHRNEETKFRIFFPKGNIGKLQAIDNELPKIDEKWSHKIIQLCNKELMNRFAKLENIGKVYLDTALINYNIPFSQRSASKSLKTLARGSCMDLPKSNILRFFLYWKDSDDSRTDIDLSALLFDDNWQYSTHVSYTKIKDEDFQLFHSGDITSAPNGASEFVDINLKKVLENKGRYIVISLNSFTNQPFCDLEGCFMGWMVRKFPKSNEIYEPKTVAQKVDLSANTKICIPIIIDLVERKIYWADLALSSNPNYENNIERNYSNMELMARSIIDFKKPNIYDLIMLHVWSRNGELVEKKKNADIIFSIEEGITPFDHEELNQFMA